MHKAGMVLMLVGICLAFGSLDAADRPYVRGDWPHWSDEDFDCQDTRQEVLLRDARPGTVQLSPDGCRVIAGAWEDPYTGVMITDPRQLDVDHIVPLKRAHEDGGAVWSREHKQRYANELSYRGHLVAVGQAENRGKGAHGPEAWRPTNRAYWCRYGEQWAVVKALFGLMIRPEERTALRELVATC